MKKHKNKVKAKTQRTVANDFLRGFLVSGMAAAVAEGGSARLDARTLKIALQGGAALATATLAADAVQDRRYLAALLATAGGIGSVYALEKLCTKSMCPVLAKE